MSGTAGGGRKSNQPATMNSQFPSRLAAMLTLAAALATAAGTAGCAAVAAGAGAGVAVAYVRGDLDTTISTGLDKALRASNRAIEQLKFAKISERADAIQATMIARNSADKRIELHLEKLADDATKLKIRVGTFGDDALQVAILDRIKANL